MVAGVAGGLADSLGVSHAYVRAAFITLLTVWGLGALLRYAVTGEPPLAGTSPFSRKAVAERIAALKASYEDRAEVAYALILEVHPEAARGRRAVGEISITVGG